MAVGGIGVCVGVNVCKGEAGAACRALAVHP